MQKHELLSLPTDLWLGHRASKLLTQHLTDSHSSLTICLPVNY